MIDFGCASPRILCITFKCSNFKVCKVVVGYALNFGGMVKKGRMTNRIMHRVVNGYRLHVLGDLNGYIVDGMKMSLTGLKNDTGRTVVEFYVKMGLCMGNI